MPTTENSTARQPKTSTTSRISPQMGTDIEINNDSNPAKEKNVFSSTSSSSSDGSDSNESDDAKVDVTKEKNTPSPPPPPPPPPQPEPEEDTMAYLLLAIESLQKSTKTQTTKRQNLYTDNDDLDEMEDIFDSDNSSSSSSSSDDEDNKNISVYHDDSKRLHLGERRGKRVRKKTAKLVLNIRNSNPSYRNNSTSLSMFAYTHGRLNSFRPQNSHADQRGINNLFLTNAEKKRLKLDANKLKAEEKEHNRLVKMMQKGEAKRLKTAAKLKMKKGKEKKIAKKKRDNGKIAKDKLVQDKRKIKAKERAKTYKKRKKIDIFDVDIDDADADNEVELFDLSFMNDPSHFLKPNSSADYTSLNLLEWRRRIQYNPRYETTASKKRLDAGKYCSDDDGNGSVLVARAVLRDDARIHQFVDPFDDVLTKGENNDVDVYNLSADCTQIKVSTIDGNENENLIGVLPNPPRKRKTDEVYASQLKGIANALKSKKVRRFLRCEFFYSDVDRAFFSDSEFMKLMSEMGLGDIIMLSRLEWNLVKRRMQRRHKVRRFSVNFVASQIKALTEYRQNVKCIQLGHAIPTFAYTVPSLLPAATLVSAYSLASDIIHRGNVLIVKDDGYVVRFTRREMMDEFCLFIDVAGHGPNNNIQECSSTANENDDAFNGTSYGSIETYYGNLKTSLLKKSIFHGGKNNLPAFDVRVEQLLENSAVLKVQSALSCMIDRKTALIDGLKGMNDYADNVVISGGSLIGNAEFKKHYEWIEANLDVTNYAISNAMEVVRCMYGGLYGGGKVEVKSDEDRGDKKIQFDYALNIKLAQGLNDVKSVTWKTLLLTNAKNKAEEIVKTEGGDALDVKASEILGKSTSLVLIAMECVASSIGPGVMSDALQGGLDDMFDDEDDGELIESLKRAVNGLTAEFTVRSTDSSGFRSENGGRGEGR